MQYTPGPWRQTGVNIRAGDALIAFATDHYADEHLMESEKMANARLIAAAPQLLRALQRLTHPAADDDDLAYALDVIRVATGAP